MPTVAATGPSPRTIRQIAGYRIERQLGAGGMGTVYQAHDEKMNRRVALKVLARHLTDGGRSEERFAREAWIAGKLNHPNLVRVFERGEDDDLSFFTMEIVDGGSVGDVLKSLRASGRDDSLGLVFGTRAYVTWAIEQVVQASRGLEHAHRQGVVHRDIKPMNILLAKDPSAAKVADFGLAVDLAATRVTTVGTLMGTIVYMAPEQIRGRNDLIGPATDVYALGVTLFEMLTLEFPYSGETQQMYVNAVLTAAAKKPRKLNERVGRDLEVVIGKALEKNPKDRYQSAGALADDLENILRFRPIDATPTSIPRRLGQWARRRPMHAAVAGILLVGLPVTAFLGTRAVQHQRLETQLQVESWREEAGRFIYDEKYREALGPLDHILEAAPADLEAMRDRSLARVFLTLRESDPAIRSALESRSLDDITHVIERLPEAGWPRRVRAFLFTSFGRQSEAAVENEAASRLATSSPEPIELEIEGRLAFMSGDRAAAVAAFGEVIRLRPEAAVARLWRARSYEALGEMTKAMTDYEVAAALKPVDASSRVSLGRLKTLSGSLDEGASLFQQVLEREPGNAVAHEGMSDNFVAQGRAATAAADTGRARTLFSQAAKEARLAIASDATLSWARVNLGASLMELNRQRPDPALVREAVEQYALAIVARHGQTNDPHDQILLSALVNQCDALIQVGQLSDALRSCGRVVELQPKDATAHYNLAAVHALSGRPDEALRALEKDVETGDRDWQYMIADPWFESLRSDDRFGSLVARMRKAAP